MSVNMLLIHKRPGSRRLLSWKSQLLQCLFGFQHPPEWLFSLSSTIGTTSLLAMCVSHEVHAGSNWVGRRIMKLALHPHALLVLFPCA